MQSIRVDSCSFKELKLLPSAWRFRHGLGLHIWKNSIALKFDKRWFREKFGRSQAKSLEGKKFKFKNNSFLIEDVWDMQFSMEEVQLCYPVFPTGYNKCSQLSWLWFWRSLWVQLTCWIRFMDLQRFHRSMEKLRRVSKISKRSWC